MQIMTRNALTTHYVNLLHSYQRCQHIKQVIQKLLCVKFVEIMVEMNGTIQTFWATQRYKEILNTNKIHSHSTSGIKGNCDSLYGVWTFHYICLVASTNRPCGVWVGSYTYTIPQFVVGSFKLDSVPLQQGSILDLGVTALITTGGPQPVTYVTIHMP